MSGSQDGVTDKSSGESVSTGSGGGSSRQSDGENEPALQELLEESRTTLSEQLGQIDKIDTAAVRTVRISLLILGILAGGPALVPFPDLGLAGAIGTTTLVLTLIGAISTYGTSRVFIGSAPDELNVDYTDFPTTESTSVEILSEYDEGISENRNTLRANGFLLAVSRTLLVISIVTILYGITANGAPPSGTVQGLIGTAPILILSQWLPSGEMSETQSTEQSTEATKPVSVYTGPKKIADAKVALGEWLEKHGL